MSMRRSAAITLSAVLFLGAGKPPGLPIDRPVSCAPESAPAAETPPPDQDTKPAVSTLVFGVTVDSQVGTAASVLVSERGEPATPSRGYGFLAGWWRWLVADLGGADGTFHLEVTGELPVALDRFVDLADALPEHMCLPPEPQPALVAAAEPTCPYLKACAAVQPASNAPVHLADSVLENLEALRRAHDLARVAVEHEQAGRKEAAARCYRRVHEICPGSRYDHEAAARLVALGVSPVDGAAEEAEATGPVHVLPDTPRLHCFLRLTSVTLSVDIEPTTEGHGTCLFGLGAESGALALPAWLFQNWGWLSTTYHAVTGR